MEYILKTKRDSYILKLCNKLGKNKLSKNDSDLLVLIKTQLEKDWRKHLLNRLNKLSKKYKK